MSIRSRTYNTVPGTDSVFHPSLNGVRILGVQRNGMQLGPKLPITSTPVNDQFGYGAARIYVDPNNKFNPVEKIWVLYET